MMMRARGWNGSMNDGNNSFRFKNGLNRDSMPHEALNAVTQATHPYFPAWANTLDTPAQHRQSSLS